MKKTLPLLFLTLALASCNSKVENKQAENALTVVVDTTPRVTGIGGIFFGSSNPKETREWYGNNLGLAIDEYGSPFEFRNANNPNEKNYLRWAPFKKNDEYLSPSKKEFMINYRVYNLEALLKKLRNNGVVILDSIAQYDYGKFVHILDLDSNKIELWEPVDSVLTKLGGKTTK
ncbi:MAG: VOC family protein [Bacteroidota bacterium]